MIRAVPDTNIWLASIRWRGLPYKIRTLGEVDEVRLLTSLSILSELTRVLREYFNFPDDIAYEWYQRIVFYSELISPKRFINAVPNDADDNKFVECAVEGKADYIISRDNDLLQIGEYNGILILNDVDFMAILEAEEDDSVSKTK
ncbi:putative toxin-antitoxin system toxin component, PIN family [Candidatus Poribacteria bacterium]|nr:putative toxin-antitoxin system toxin component, PIN family [Candidatus Poribacteria bacterium]